MFELQLQKTIVHFVLLLFATFKCVSECMCVRVHE